MQFRKTTLLILAVALFLAVAVPGSASELATATIASLQLDPTHFHYDIVLQDTGTTNIGTFWFSWIPGQDYMPTIPSNLLNPTGWTSSITHGGAADGYAIRWTAGGGSAILPGGSLSGFGFDSQTTPQQMAGASNFFANPPVLTSFVYSGAPFSDAGFQFVVTGAGAAPEPSTWFSLGTGVAAVLALRRRRAARS